MDYRQRFAMLQPGPAGSAHCRWLIGRTRKWTVAYNRQFRQHGSKRAYRCRFSRPLLSANEYAANGRLNSIEDEGQFHLFLAHNCAEWICVHDLLIYDSLHPRMRLCIRGCNAGGLAKASLDCYANSMTPRMLWPSTISA